MPRSCQYHESYNLWRHNKLFRQGTWLNFRLWSPHLVYTTGRIREGSLKLSPAKFPPEVRSSTGEACRPVGLLQESIARLHHAVGPRFLFLGVSPWIKLKVTSLETMLQSAMINEVSQAR
jgi:hypothetical protein